MSDKVIPIGCVTRLDLPVDTVLEKAKGMLNCVVIIGWDKNGDSYFASTTPDGGEVLWLIESCKKALMSVELPE